MTGMSPSQRRDHEDETCPDDRTTGTGFVPTTGQGLVPSQPLDDGNPFRSDDETTETGPVTTTGRRGPVPLRRRDDVHSLHDHSGSDVWGESAADRAAAASGADDDVCECATHDGSGSRADDGVQYGPEDGGPVGRRRRVRVRNAFLA
ncbi:hypothetical protein ACRRTK_020066 [Alexandromys fortis]